MADVKISALGAASLPLSLSDVIPVVQAGTSKQATVADVVRAYTTVKTLGSDQTVSSTTAASIHTDLEASLVPGTYIITGTIVFQSAATTTGIEVYFNCSGGTITRITALIEFLGNTTTASGNLDMVVTGNQVMEGRAQRTNNTATGPLLSVDTANADCLLVVNGAVIVTATTTVQFMVASEVAAANVTVMAGSALVFERVA